MVLLYTLKKAYEYTNYILCTHIFDKIMIVDNLWVKILEDNYDAEYTFES